ncbi:MAG: FKBP-type peptidyl-prolyl cis-trans isomerase [Thermoplasmata archaeon]
MAEERSWPPRISLFQVVIAIVVVSAILIGYFVATLPRAPSGPLDTAQLGDVVQVDYVGYFEDGRVFDTSIAAVAEDDAGYPKALSFTLRDTYRPLEFLIGGTETPVIEGFEEGIIGMREGEVKLIEVPPEKGYGLSDPSQIEVRPILVELTVFETLTVDDFEQRFEAGPVQGMIVRHPLWGWNVTVMTLQPDFVTIMHLPEQGMIVKPYGTWEAKVVEVDSSANEGAGRIAVRHLLDRGHIDNVQGEDDGGTFRVVDVDLVNGTYTVDYNREVVGRTLIFQVELLKLTRF